jgi:hypothetical protein
MVSRTTLWRLRQDAYPLDQAPEAAVQSGETVSNWPPEGHARVRPF